MTEVTKYILLILGGYFIGNISFARIVSAFIGEDITKKGSGNPGAMNMFRSFGLKLGLITMVLDMAKTSIPCLFGFYMFGGDGSAASYIGLYVGGVSTLVGHIYPVFYGFKGGKGIACSLGIFAFANPIWFAVSMVGGFLIMAITEYGAISSLFIIAFMVTAEAIRLASFESVTISILLFVIFALTWYRHKSNIKKLLTGKGGKVPLQKSLGIKKKDK